MHMPLLKRFGSRIQPTPSSRYRRHHHHHPRAFSSSSSAVNETTPWYRLVYFDSRGAAELTRYVLAVAEVPYDDLRYPLRAAAAGFGVGSADESSSSMRYARDRRTGAFAVNMDRLPVLQVLTPDGKAAVATLGQSHAVNRFLAERHGLMGHELLQRARIDAVYESVRDIRSEFLQVKRTRSRDRSRWMETSLPERCQRLEASLPPPRDAQATTGDDDDDGPWIVCCSSPHPSLADIAVFSLLGTAVSVTSGSLVTAFDDLDPSPALDRCPRLQASVRAMGALPAIRQWHAQRPDTFS